jgi:hypothetical protein
MSNFIVTPISDEDLDAVCAFWQMKFQSRCSIETWKRAFRQNWAAEKPNNGFMLRRGSEIVGALGAIYSDQTIGGKKQKFCNMTSWYVVDEHRGRGLALLLRVIEQEGFTFTNLSSSSPVEKLLLHAGFTALPRDIYSVPNLAVPFWQSSQVRVINEPSAICQVLAPERRQICRDHAECLRGSQLAIGSERDGYCHVMFSRGRCRYVPCIIVLDIDAPHLLRKFWTHFAFYVLSRTGAIITRIEARLLKGARLPCAMALKSRSGAFFLSRTLGPDAISRRYSEAMVLSGC